MKIDTQWTMDFNHKINKYDINVFGDFPSFYIEKLNLSKLDKNLLFQFMCLIRDQNNVIN